MNEHPPPADRLTAILDVAGLPDGSAVAVVLPGGGLLTAGPRTHVFALASVTKPLTAYAVLLAVQEGALELDQPAGPPGSTVAHLLAHASGLSPGDAEHVLAAPGTRRIYSNAGFEVLGRAVEDATDIAFADYLREAVLEPLGMNTASLDGSPAHAGRASLDDVAAFAGELLSPRLLDPASLTAATGVAFPGLAGVLPGFGAQPSNDWGLGFEIRDGKSPHWTGATNSPATFGHFGQSGTFVWIDPALGAGAVCLTGKAFGPWAAQVWPPLNDALVALVRDAGRP
jgi:CubicO group peptidase (beta-lactamase class C family)